jgi:Tol biopolymer transport system component
MHYDMSKLNSCRQKTRSQGLFWAITRLAVVGLVLLLTACAAARLTPAATPVPLLVTATARPAATQPAPTVATEAVSTAAPAASATATTASALSSLDDLLARRTVEDLLARLERGEAHSIVNLYLSEQALQAGLDRIFLDLGAAGWDLARAEMLELRRATASSYEARVLLHWAKALPGEAASQPMTLTLVYQRGLWLVDRVSLGDLRSGDTSNGQQTQVSPGGSTSRTARQVGRLVFQVSSGGPIYLIDADGSKLRRLTDGLDPAWSPGGDQIAFIRWRQPTGIYLIDPRDGTEEKVVDGDRLKEVAWSPDGARIAYTVDRGTGEPREVCVFGFCFTIPASPTAEIWTADLASGELLNLPLIGQMVRAPTWSPLGERIVYVDGRGLAWIDLGGMETGRFQDSSAWDMSPTFSPDGRRLAFMSRIHDHWEVLTMYSDGSGRQQLTRSDPLQENPASNVAPAWSPDGTSIAFLSNRDGPWRIYIMGADGSGQRSMFGAQLDGLGLSYEWAAERVISWTR